MRREEEKEGGKEERKESKRMKGQIQESDFLKLKPETR